MLHANILEHKRKELYYIYFLKGWPSVQVSRNYGFREGYDVHYIFPISRETVFVIRARVNEVVSRVS